MNTLLRGLSGSLLLTGTILAQAYPTFTARVENSVFWFEAVASVSQPFPPAGSAQSLPTGTDITAGMDLNAAYLNSTSRTRFSLQQFPFRCELRSDIVDAEAQLIVDSHAPIKVTMNSAHPVSGVMRVSRTFPTGLPNPLSHTAACFVMIGGRPVNWDVTNGPQTTTIPFVSTGSLDITIWGQTTIPALATGQFGHLITLELISTQSAYEPNFAPGCPGSSGQVTLSPVSPTPVLGATFDTLATNLPTGSVALGLLGFQPIPTDLGPLLAPGCVVRTDLAMVRVLTHAGGSGTWSLWIPNDPGLFGLAIYQQVFVLDPPANPLGVSVSNCGRGLLGL